MLRVHILFVLIAAAWLAFSPLAAASDGDFYADARVARLADVSGDVSLAPAGTDRWGEAYRNRPLIAGDRLITGPRGRAAMQLGDAAVRMDDESALRFLSLDARLVQIELSRGSLNLRVDEMYGDQIYEVDTPTLAFVAAEPGSYRIDVAPSGYGAMVTVFAGHGTVYGRDGESRRVYAGRSYRFDDARLARVDVDNIPRRDDFDRYCASLDHRYANSVSGRYVAGNVIGYRDLDRYGTWHASVSYGSIWYPSHVGVDWRPYRDGRWAWVQPWGWTWVDNAPWGFAPFHYGRWAYVGHRWGWIPGPRHHRAVYAPALVAFIGGSNWSLSIGLGNIPPVGWFPLGPRDLYLPPYHVDRNYFRRVNITNVRVVNNTVINNFYDDYTDHRVTDRRQYAYRNNPRAVTVVSRDVFTSASPVARSAQVLSERTLAKVSVSRSPQIAPHVASLGVSPRGRPPALASKAFDSNVVTRHKPRAQPVAFAKRQPVIASQNGTPLSAVQRRDLRQANAAKLSASNAAHSAPRGKPAPIARTASRADSAAARPSRSVSSPKVASARAAPKASRESRRTSTPRGAPSHNTSSRMIAAPPTVRAARASASAPRSRPERSTPRRKSAAINNQHSRRSSPVRTVRAPIARTHSAPTPRGNPKPSHARDTKTAHIASVPWVTSTADARPTPRARPTARSRSTPRVVQRHTARSSRTPRASQHTPRSAPPSSVQREPRSHRRTVRSASRPVRARTHRASPSPQRESTRRRVSRQSTAAPTRSRSHSAPRSSRQVRTTTRQTHAAAESRSPRGAPRTRKHDD